MDFDKNFKLYNDNGLYLEFLEPVMTKGDTLWFLKIEPYDISNNNGFDDFLARCFDDSGVFAFRGLPPNAQNKSLVLIATRIAHQNGTFGISCCPPVT